MRPFYSVARHSNIQRSSQTVFFGNLRRHYGQKGDTLMARLIEQSLEALKNQEKAFQIAESLLNELSSHPEPSTELLNRFISEFCQYNYSIVNRLLEKKLPISSLETSTIENIVKYNPGRVNSSFEIVEMLAKKDESLIRSLIQSSCITDHILWSEIQEDGKIVESISESTAKRVAHLFLSFDFQLRDDLLAKHLLNLFSEKGMLTLLGDKAFSKLGLDQNPGLFEGFLNLSTVSLPEDMVCFLYNNRYSRFNDKLCKISTKYLTNPESQDNRISENYKILASFPQFTKSQAPSKEDIQRYLISQIESLKTSASFEFFGFGLGDFQPAFFAAERDESHGQTALRIAAYNTIKSPEFLEKNKKNIDKLASLYPQLNLWLVLIFFRDLDSSIEIFNNSINRPNQDNGKLVDSLFKAVLLNRNRELAMIVVEKSIQNKLISSAQPFKKILKHYGEGLDEQNGNQSFVDYILSTI